MLHLNVCLNFGPLSCTTEAKAYNEELCKAGVINSSEDLGQWLRFY